MLFSMDKQSSRLDLKKEERNSSLKTRGFLTSYSIFPEKPHVFSTVAFGDYNLKTVAFLIKSAV